MSAASNQILPAILGLMGGALGIGLALHVFQKLGSNCWAGLSSRYPLVVSGGQDEIRFRTIAVKPGPYYSCINFGFCTALKISPQSLNIRIQFPFAFFFNPVSIPWQAVENVELKKLPFRGRVAIVRIKDFSPLIYFYCNDAQQVYEQWSRR